MSSIIFVDTGAIFAGICRNDQYHQQARLHAAQLEKSGSRLVTSNLVVSETAMLLERKVNRREAIRFLETIRRDKKIQVVHAGEALEEKAFLLYTQYSDQDFSITDCVSFSMMRKLRLRRCFTFDSHFTAMGFTVEPL